MVDASVIESAVAEAGDALYEALSSGRVVRVPAGFLWGTANNKLRKRNAAGLAVREPFDEQSEEHNRGDDDESEEDREELRREAVRFARSVLPSLGQTTVVRVMTVLLLERATGAGLDVAVVGAQDHEGLHTCAVHSSIAKRSASRKSRPWRCSKVATMEKLNPTGA